jgi:N,N'-diacetyllegionaminate synthase
MANHGMLDVINSCAGTVKRVYLSTGMATIEEVRSSLDHLDRIEEVTILHCVTQYPVPARLANLWCLRTPAEAFPAHAIGYSDHTVGLVACLAAVALGATVLEKHFTLSKQLPGTDHVASMLPEELALLRQQVGELELMLGDGSKAPCEEELAIIEFVRSRFHDLE